MLAYVVAIRGAAKPDKDGLLQPLLRRWQAGGCGCSVFALPAVQARRQGLWGALSQASSVHQGNVGHWDFRVVQALRMRLT